MEQLERKMYLLLSLLPNEQEVRERLDSLVPIYPFNEYEYIISKSTNTLFPTSSPRVF